MSAELWTAEPFVPESRSMTALARCAVVHRLPSLRRHDADGLRLGCSQCQQPTTLEADACHPWLAAELDAVRAKVVVALGAVAARSLSGKPISATRSADELFALDGRQLLVTYHPSAALRAEEQASEIRARIIADLRRAEHLADSG